MTVTARPGRTSSRRFAWPSPAPSDDIEPHAPFVDARAPSTLGLEQVRCSEERRHRPVRGISIDFLGRADLLDTAAVHHDHTVGQRHRFGLVVRHIEARHAEPLLDRAKLVAHLQAQLRVEIAQRLVEQQHLRLEHERARDRDALLLAARQRGCRPLAEPFHFDKAQRLRDALRDLGRGRRRTRSG